MNHSPTRNPQILELADKCEGIALEHLTGFVPVGLVDPHTKALLIDPRNMIDPGKELDVIEVAVDLHRVQYDELAAQGQLEDTLLGYAHPVLVEAQKECAARIVVYREQNAETLLRCAAIIAAHRALAELRSTRLLEWSSAKINWLTQRLLQRQLLPAPDDLADRDIAKGMAEVRKTVMAEMASVKAAELLKSAIL